MFRCGIPQTDGLITTATSEGLPIGTERHAPHPIRMPGEGVLVRPGDRIPETDFPPTPRCEGATIRTERDASDIPSMPREGCRCAPVFASQRRMV